MKNPNITRDFRKVVGGMEVFTKLQATTMVSVPVSLFKKIGFAASKQ
jgi:hypothetical protein